MRRLRDKRLTTFVFARCDDALRDAVDAVARAEGVRHSDAVRELLAAGLREYEREKEGGQ